MGRIGTYEPDLEFDASNNSRYWEIDVQTYPSEFTGLNLVELTVTEVTDAVYDDSNYAPMSFTLRQLMQPREADVEAYQEDELLDGLPEIEP